MPKETKKKAKAPAEKEPKKNPLLDSDEETSASEEAEESDEVTELDEPEEEETEEAPKKAPSAPSKPEEAAPKVNVAAEMLSDIARTKKILDAEEKVQFYVPLFEGEKPGSIHQCFINGYMVPVKKGVMTLVPQSIANMLADHFKINSEVGADFRLDLNENKQNALG